MTTQELAALIEHLEKFDSFMDARDAVSIEKASTISLASRLLAQHELNSNAIKTVISMVKAIGGAQ